MAVLSHMLKPPEMRTKYWRDIILQVGFDSATQYIPPEETCLNPAISLRVRLNILLRTYNHDYHTDAYDFERLASAVRDGWERISFWGDKESIDVLRDWLKKNHEPTERELYELSLGTGTILDAKEEFGEGYAEMCRTGSICSSVIATGPILWDLVRLFEDSSDNNFAHYHTFSSVPRNRISSGDIRGGAAIHRLHVREIGSSFWGVAPWYVMQGGNLEVLDYRELYRRPADVTSAVSKTRNLYCSTEAEAAYLSALLKLNLEGIAELPKIRVENSLKLPATRWYVRSPVRPELAPYNPIFIQLDPCGAFATLQEADSYAESEGHSCITVFLPLDDPSIIAYPHLLGSLGYSLTAMSPPKEASDVLSSGSNIGRRIPCYGMWSRVHSGISLAKPYYLDHRGHMPVENVIIRYLSEIYNQR
jgi:hypothetical protein